MTFTLHTTTCSGCGKPLPDNFQQPCQKCGSTRKTHHAEIHEVVHARATLGWRHIHEYYERHRILLPLVLVITLGSPFLGLILAGWRGVGAGLAIGIATFFLGLRAVTKVREIREHNES